MYHSLEEATHGNGNHSARDNDHVARPQEPDQGQYLAGTAFTNQQQCNYDSFAPYPGQNMHSGHETRTSTSTTTAANFPFSTDSEKNSSVSDIDTEEVYDRPSDEFPTELANCDFNDPFRLDWSGRLIPRQPHQHPSDSASTDISCSTGSPHQSERHRNSVTCENCGQQFRGKYAHTNCRRHQREATCRMRIGSREKALCRQRGCGQSFSRSDNRNTHERARYGRVLA